jgi:hypothetical protein
MRVQTTSHIHNYPASGMLQILGAHDIWRYSYRHQSTSTLAGMHTSNTECFIEGQECRCCCQCGPSLRAHENPVLGVLKVLHGHSVLVVVGRLDCSNVDQVHQIRPRERRRACARRENLVMHLSSSQARALAMRSSGTRKLACAGMC